MEKRIEIMGVPIDNVTLNGAIDTVMDFIHAGGVHVVVTPNSEILETAGRDTELMHALKNASLAIPDGVGVLYASKILGEPLLEKVPGCDLCLGILPRLEQAGGRLFLLGGKPGVAQKAASRIKERYPRLEICGVCDGYFQADAPILCTIKKSKPNVVLVCLGAPKQEKWMEKNKAALTDVVMIGAGGTIDLLAGNVERAPDFFVRHGLEWFYRLSKEPKRIGRMMKLPVFGAKVLLRRMRGK